MKALYAGSFHPPTNGHLDIIRRGAELFDEVIVAIMVNASKHYVISAEERLYMLEKCLKDIPNARAVIGEGLTAGFARDTGADVLLRGLRGVADFDSELAIADVNRRLYGIDTFFLTAQPENRCVSSTVVTDIARHGGSISGFVPPEIKNDIIACLVREKGV